MLRIDIRRALRLLHESLLRHPGDRGSPEDPLTPVREPIHRRPGGRGTAVAVAEPDPPSPTHAVGGANRRL